MGKYELSISPDYVSDWTIVDAVRELFQNALDQQTIQPNNEMFFTYENGVDDESILRIGNKSSVLDVQTLLLGHSSKRDDNTTIGKFGEGYKIATIVLLRLGKEIIFYNYGRNEVWKPRLVKSRRYGGAKILTFFTEKYVWRRPPDNNLTIEIKGVTFKEYLDIMASNLHLQGDYDTISTSYGDILLDSQHKGQVFVNGLYVCTMKDFHYGYDIKPNYISLDRDRKLVRDLDIQWITSKMWNQSGSEILLDLVKKKAADSQYIDRVAYDSPSIDVCNKAFERFREDYGDNAIPVSNQAQMESVRSRYKDAEPIIVSENEQYLIINSENYDEGEFETIDEPDPKEELLLWYRDIEELLDEEQKDRFHRIFEAL